MRFKKMFQLPALCVLILSTLSPGGFAASPESEEAEHVFVPIIMYHEVSTHRPGKDVIYPWEFESDLKYLAANNYTTITIEDLIRYVDGESGLPEKPIILTFDDGYLNNYVYAFPLLKQYQVKIVFSIIGRNTDEFTNSSNDNLDYAHVTWPQLNEMLESGLVEVQNHSYDLHGNGKGRIGCGRLYGESDTDYERTFVEDTTMLQEKITAATSRTPTAYVYPLGAYNDYTESLLKEMGFRATLTCDFGNNKITRDPDALYCLKRACRSHNQNFEKMLNYVSRIRH